jgi:hypothetical protein
MTEPFELWDTETAKLRDQGRRLADVFYVVLTHG